MQVFIHLPKLRHNLAFIRDICRSAGLQPVWITKGCQAHPDILQLLLEQPREVVGDVSPANIKRARRIFPGKVMMAQLPDPDRVAAIGSGADVWLVSAPDHARMIAALDRPEGHPQELVLMVDVGNRREGVLPEQTVAAAEAIQAVPGVSLIGLGTSVGCYGGYRAGLSDMERLVAIAQKAETRLDCRFDVLSAGSGTMLLDLVAQGNMPARINQLRIGAAVFVGEMPPTRTAIPGLYQDAFILQGEVLETSLKPSLPAGSTGRDAFGKQVAFEDRGPRQLCVLNFGLLDVDAYDLAPLTEGLRIVGATSNYTICDTTCCTPRPAIGDTLAFRMAYSAMARVMASDDVAKVFVTSG
jgi:predicted amino acid racemase